MKEVQSLLLKKADKADTYSKRDTDELMDVSQVLDGARLEMKADKDATYSKADTYSVAEVDAIVASLQTALVQRLDELSESKMDKAHGCLWKDLQSQLGMQARISAATRYGPR